VEYQIEGVTDPDVTLTVEGTIIEVDEDGLWAAVVQLGSGENIIAVLARDILGNKAEEVVHLILDTEPPSLIVLFPLNGYITEEDSVTVDGRTDVGANVTVNGEEAAINDKGLFSHKVDLEIGVQNITVISTDQAGNEAKIVNSVERKNPQEPSEPTPPPSTGTSTAALLAAVLIIAIAAGAGYMYLKGRRGSDMER
jgi:LPXTG-motif cell wall-anchored protein